MKQLERQKGTKKLIMSLKKQDCSDLSVIVTGTQLSKMEREGQDVVLAVICLMIEGLTGHFKVKVTFENEREIMIAASNLVKRFWYLKIEELAIVFDRAKGMKYGKVYRLDEGTIIEWVTEYEKTERENYIYDENSRLKDQATSGKDMRIDYGVFRVKPNKK